MAVRPNRDKTYPLKGCWQCQAKCRYNHPITRDISKSSDVKSPPSDIEKFGCNTSKESR